MPFLGSLRFGRLLAGLLLIGFALTASAPAAAAPLGQAAEEGADLGAQRWRSGDRDGALAAWTTALEGGALEGGALEAGTDLPSAERARLAYNLGIAEYERGEPLRAVAWFEASLRAAPRSAPTRENLEIARAEAGLGPRRGDDLTATLIRVTSSFSRTEAEWFALFGTLLLVLAGLGEALRGGAGWRRLLLVAVVAQLAFFAPLARHVATADDRPYMVVDPDGASARSEPDSGADQLGTIPAGSIVEYVDELPGWTKIRHEGDERWVEAAVLFDLRV
ncbi:MAG: SH3 domain-containing protein [Planctomycetota bacterium]